MPATVPSAALALGLALGLLAAAPAAAQSPITVRDAYITVAGAMAVSAGAFMVIENHGPAGDRLLAAAVPADVARRSELHRNVEDAQGVMRMVAATDGFAIPAGGEHALARGGDHVMILGLRHPLAAGDIVTMTLTFAAAGEVVVAVPVGEPAAGMAPGHGH
ncbi:MAG: copper chaperone PCu(A)C [Rhodobacteraceae bacterium]|nr:copper chaperone PCu(A)C [Paracoccaceae bacterium]